MKQYIKSDINPTDLSKERLEILVGTILDITEQPELGSSRQLMKIIQVLEFYGLR